MQVINGIVFLEGDSYQKLLEFSGAGQKPPLQAKQFIEWLQRVLGQRQTSFEQLMEATFLASQLKDLETVTNHPNPRGDDLFRQCLENFEQFLEDNENSGSEDIASDQGKPNLH